MKTGRLLFACGAIVGLATGWLLPRSDRPGAIAPEAADPSSAAPSRPDRPPGNALPQRGHTRRPASTHAGPATSGEDRFAGLFALLVADETQFLNPIGLARELAEIGRLGGDEALDLLHRLNGTIEDDSVDDDFRNLATALVFSRLCELDGPAAMALLADPAYEDLWEYEPEVFGAMGVNAWFASDPQGAARWFGSQLRAAEEWVAREGESADLPGVMALLECEELRHAFMRGMALRDPDGMQAWIDAMDHPEAREQLIEDAACARVQAARSADELVALLPSISTEPAAVRDALVRLADADGQAAADWIGSHPTDPSLDFLVGRIGRHLLEQDIEGGLAWYMARDLSQPADRSERLRNISAALAGLDPARADAWLLAQPDDELRDQAEAGLAAQAAMHSQWDRSMRWIAALGHPEERMTNLQSITLLQGSGPEGVDPALIEAAERAGLGDLLAPILEQSAAGPIGRSRLNTDVVPPLGR